MVTIEDTFTVKEILETSDIKENGNVIVIGACSRCILPKKVIEELKKGDKTVIWFDMESGCYDDITEKHSNIEVIDIVRTLDEIVEKNKVKEKHFNFNDLVIEVKPQADDFYIPEFPETFDRSECFYNKIKNTYKKPIRKVIKPRHF